MLKKSAALVLVILGAYLAVKYLLPLTTPFLLGALLAALAEPAVRVLAGRLRLRRSFASAIGVSASLALLVGAALALLSVAYREIQLLMDRFPDLVETAQMLKIPQGTAASRQRKALKLLRLELEEEVTA